MNSNGIIDIIHGEVATYFTHLVPHGISGLLVADVMTASLTISGAGLEFITIHFD